MTSTIVVISAEPFANKSHGFLTDSHVMFVHRSAKWCGVVQRTRLQQSRFSEVLRWALQDSNL